MLLVENFLNVYARQGGLLRMRFLIQSIGSFVFLVIVVFWWFLDLNCLYRLAFSFNSLYQGSAIVMQWYFRFSILIKKILENLCFLYSTNSNDSIYLNFLCSFWWSKYVTGTWSWKILCWMEVQLLGWRYVILVTPRYCLHIPASVCHFCAYLVELGITRTRWKFSYIHHCVKDAPFNKWTPALEFQFSAFYLWPHKIRSGETPLLSL